MICRRQEVVLPTPFLERFAEHLLARLVRDGGIELVPGSMDAAVDDLAERLGQPAVASLVTEVGRALERSPFVVELYLDDDALRATITDLDPSAAR